MQAGLAQIAITGFIRVAAEERATLTAILREHIPIVREKDGCILYTFAEDVVDRDVIRMSELWTGQAALDRHLASDDFLAVRQRVTALQIVERSVQKHKISATEDI